jgi:prephenate dehydrogenase
MIDDVMSPPTIGIVGLGLMGSSLGLALAQSGASRLGADQSPSVAARALELGAVDEVATVAQLASRVDLLVLCAPVAAATQLVLELAPLLAPGAVMTDVGSTKSDICRALDSVAPAVATIGGHPMCGRELSGPDAADAAMFQGATWALVPTDGTTDRARTLATWLVESTGARAVELDRDAHDRAVATGSHLPYVVAQALVATLVESEAQLPAPAPRLTATGFRGASRLARGDVDMWLDVLATNSSNIRESIALLQVELGRLSDALDDSDELRTLLRSGCDAVADVGEARA